MVVDGVRVAIGISRGRVPRAHARGGGARYRRGGRNSAPRLRGGVDRLPVRPNDLHPEQEPDRVFLELQHHGFEHVERLALVGHQRILLRIAAQPDALFQVVHREQVILPQAVDHAQHHHALVIAHRLRAENLLLGLVVFLQLFEDFIAQFVARQFQRLDA